MANIGRDITAFVVAAVMIWGPMAAAARLGSSEPTNLANPTSTPATTGTVAPGSTTN
jgi:hypothetical protein